MKKLFTIALVIVIMCTLCACGPSDAENKTIPEKIYAENPLFVCIGEKITIDGVTYEASVMCMNVEGNFYNTSAGTFYVNRANNHVFCVQHEGSGRSGTSHAFDTGLVYEGTITVNGVEVPKPNN